MSFKKSLILMLILLIPFTLAQTTIVLNHSYVLDDAEVRCDQSSTNLGGSTGVGAAVTGSLGSESVCREFYVRFNIDDSVVPPGQTITSAELGLRATGIPLSAGQELSIGSFRVLPSYLIGGNPWTEDSVVFDNKPTSGDIGVGGSSVNFLQGSLFQRYYWDVTSIVSDAYAEEDSVSFLLTPSIVSGTFDSSSHVTFGSKENSLAGRQPSLTIEYQSGGPVSGPGDVNLDGMVDLDDLIFMTLNLGNSGFDPVADINSDGQVNIFDMVVVARNYGNDYTGGSVCGDSTCDAGETCSSCPADCGSCGPVCGDSTCDAGETCSSCPADCGSCGPVCGDSTCDAGETCSSCPGDCGSCTTCGDSVCEVGESCGTCPGDCGVCSDPGVVFATDWSTATGTSDDAVRDTDKPLPYLSRKGPIDAFVIVPASTHPEFNGTGLPNVAETWNYGAFAGVRINGPTATSGACTPGVSCIPWPQNTGEDIYYRLYRMNVVPDSFIAGGGDAQNHQPQDGIGGGSNTNWAFNLVHNADGTWYPTLQLGDLFEQTAQYWLSTGPSSSNRIALPKNTVFRFEWRIHRETDTQFWIEARVYDLAGNLLYGPEDYYALGGVHAGDDMTDHTLFTSKEWSFLGGIQMGSNGFNGPAPNPPIMTWVDGGFAVCRNDWCGPYVPGEGT